MTKAELVDKIAAKGEITKVQAGKVLGALVDALAEAMAAGDAVMLGGLGTFKVTSRGERKGRNPRTGTEITVPACMVPKFTPAKVLKDAVAKLPVK
ncbi:MAG: HU family DNA-binding protein [Desulfovibrio sp.]|jgi:DNA-binding protein HU-beta|nr:HU family DNA-binding protein [Desulfovibrio sp.]